MKMTTASPQAPAKDAPGVATPKPRVAKRSRPTAPTKAKPARKAAQVKKFAPARKGTKTARILDLLKRQSGVTLKELMKATGWQAHSVRGFLSGAVGKKLGSPAESSKRADGERTYRLS